PLRRPSRNASQTAAGEGIAFVAVAAAMIAQTRIAPAMPASGGPSSLASHLARDTRVDLPHQQAVDLGDDAGDQHVVEITRALRVDPELFQETTGRSRHHEDAVGQHDGLADVVGDEHERLPAL